MVYAYIRVSTDKQTVENQKYEIARFCKKEGISIGRYFEETISGVKKLEKRELGKLLRKLKKDDVLIVSELSRLGRSFYMIMEILNICANKNVKIFSIKENFRTGDNIESKVIAFAFSLSAEIERQLISQRTKEALELLKAKGVKLGRPKGSKNKHSLYKENEEKIKELLAKKKKLNYISKKLKIHRNTLYKYIKDNNLVRQR